MARSYESLSDRELVELARAGEDAAFAELWRRHADAGRRYASSITRSVDSEDIVSEAFAKIFSLIKRGKGPTNGFRSYLVTAIRHTSESFGRTRRETPIDFIDDLADESSDDEHQNRSLDQSLTIAAFKSLPERWQEALWYTEVEQLSTKECAALFGIKPTAMAMLTFRAREGLREAWIQAHIADIPVESEHRWVIERLGAYARHKLPRVQQQMVEEHLRGCESCSIVAEEARYVGSQLALALLVPVIGLGAATAYIASADHGVAAAIAAEQTGGAHTTHASIRASRWHPSARATVGALGAAAVVAAVVAVSVGLVLQRHSNDSHGSQAAIPNDGASGTTHGAARTPVPSPAPSSESAGALTVAADTGALHVFYPILAGHAPAGAVVRVLQGRTVLAELTASGDGDWSTSQLPVANLSTLAVTSTLGANIQRDVVDVDIHKPAVHASTESARVTVTVVGAANAPFLLSAHGETVAASTLDASGHWSATYPASSVDLATLVVRYQAGLRFGPLESR